MASETLPLIITCFFTVLSSTECGFLRCDQRERRGKLGALVPALVLEDTCQGVHGGTEEKNYDSYARQ